MECETRSHTICQIEAAAFLTESAQETMQSRQSFLYNMCLQQGDNENIEE